MTKQSAIFVATATEMLAGSGAQLSVAYGGRHPKLIVKLKDRVFKQPFPSSPSDHRSLLNFKSQLRRRLCVELGLVDID